MKVLIVEDDEIIGKNLKQGLEEAGHDCVWSRSGRFGLEQALLQDSEIIILDQMLPEIHGLEILRRIRAAGVRTPVLILTALGSVDERVAGLEAGADDYLVKPFAFSELLARLSAIGRRAGQPNSQVLRCGPLSLDLVTRRVTRDGQDLDLTPTEFSLLELLMRFSGQVVTRRMLCEHLWDADWEGVTNVIEVHINRLRGKLDRDFDTPLLRTVRGQGYQLRAP